LKILFITHCHGNYGASRSLQLLLRNLKGHSIHLVVPRGLRHRNDLDEIRRFYGDNVEGIREFYLPFEYCYMGCPDQFMQKAANKLHNLTYECASNGIKEYMASGKFEIIHLNAPVLYPLISPALPFIVHMRDVMLMDQASAVEKVLQAKGVIFIDKGTREPFKDLPLKNDIILNNPFDMSYLERGYDDVKILSEYGLAKENLIFSCIGRIKESKGVKFIVENFRKVKGDNKILLIFGIGDKGSNYESDCRKVAGNDPRIRFMGEEADIAKVFMISDYIIRGDPWHLIGRTVFEGLYAGCDVILPGSLSDVDQNPDLKGFSAKVHLYEARNAEDLAVKIGNLTEKIKERTFRSNVEGYVEKFEQFIKKMII